MNGGHYVPRFDVRISGLTLAADVSRQITSLTFESNLDLADMFTLVLRNDRNELTDSALFDLGKEVEIHLGYGDDLRPMMLGEITSVEPSFPQGGAPTITVTGYDKSYRLRHNEPPRTPFQYMNDSAIAALIAAEALLIPVVDPSPFFHEYIQQTGSDMAFLKERAKANFFEVYVEWDKLYFRLPRPQTQAVVLEWGKNLSSFSSRLASAGMAGIEVIRGYDERLATDIVAFATGFELNPQDLVERLGSNVLALLQSLGRRVVRDQNVESPVDAANLARALLQQILDGMYEGSGTCIGNPDLLKNRYVEMRGVGKRFGGPYRLKRVTHTIDDGGYQTHFEVTQSAGAGVLPLLRKAIDALPPPDRQQRYEGVVVARVTRNTDPEQRGRVKVVFPWFGDDVESDWARCTAPMVGGGYGAQFLPDVGDEVLVSFQHGDFRKPVVVGGLWNGKNRLPAPNVDGLNNVRVLQTRSGHSITFDDTKTAERLVIHHKSGSEVTLAANGTVAINAKGKVTIDAAQTIEFAGGGPGVAREGDLADCGTLVIAGGAGAPATLTYTPPGGVPVGPGATVNLSGKISSSSKKVKSG